MKYLNLEAPDVRTFASEDPRGFFQTHGDNLILDEIQRVPSLLSYVQTLVDEPGTSRRFILTGSQNFALMAHVTQTLAGRTRLFHLLPLS